jgi:hypothetical protein
MSGHDRFQEMLARRREFTPAEREQLDGHLKGCPDCQARARAYSEQSAALRTMPQEPVPGALRARVIAAAREVHAPASGRNWFPMLAAASAFLLVAGISVFAWSQRPQGSGGQALKPPTTRPALVQSTTGAGSRHRLSGHHAKHGSKRSAVKRPGTRQNAASPGEAPPSAFSLAAGSPRVRLAPPSNTQNAAGASFPTASAVTAVLLRHHPSTSRLKRHPAATAAPGAPQIAAAPPRPTSVPPRPPSAPVAPSSTPSASIKPPAATATPPATPSTPIALSLQPGTATPSPPPPLPLPTVSSTP